MSSAGRQLLVYTFPPGSSFEGQLVGALERIESGGTVRILDALFVGRDGSSGDVVAVSMSSDGAAGMVGRLLSFRLEPDARRKATARTLEGPSGDLARSLAERLETGSAVVALVVEHTWERVLGDAISRLGGSEAVSEFVDAAEISAAADRLVGAIGS
ncbi:MAG TPA: hypothetical protein VMU39_10450 [Solirubrobacteraceae bacterium]|nr:hypothetical protein [Solirubrobacteraceae bacterium]